MPMDFPAFPAVGQEYTVGTVTYVYNGTGWVVKGSTADQFVVKSGDTMTGNLTLSDAAGATLIFDTTVAGANNRILGRKAGANRWDIRHGDSNAESGSDSGANFLIHRYSDALAASVALSINRATGVVAIPSIVASTSPTTGALTVAGGVGINGDLNVNGNINFKGVPAAPLDALAYNGMQVNGSMEVDQANSGAAVTVSGVTRSADGFSAQAAHASAVFQVQQVTCGVTGFAKMIRLFATTGGNVGSTAGDLARITTNIEGYRVSRLSFGVASGIGFTVSFWIQSTIGGTLCLAVLNRNPSDRSYITEFTVAASAWEYKTIFVPADTTGTWDNTNGLGISISIVSRCGSTFQGSVGWQAGLKLCTAATTNFFATTNNAIYITGFLVLPGTQAPTAAQSPLIMRPYDQELVTCQRYWQLLPGSALSGQATAATNVLWAGRYAQQMRAGPTGALKKTSYAAASFEIFVGGAWRDNAAPAISAFSGFIDSLNFQMTGFSGLTAGQNGTIIPNNIITLDARL